MGNRLSLTDHRTSESLQGGGTTRTYTWGYHNELLQITYGGGGTNSFTYDGSGRRVSKTDSTGSYSFVYDGDRIISDGQAVYTRAGDTRLISERRGNNSQWYHPDGLTSTRTLTNSSQTVTDTFRYDVWGDVAERTGNTPTPHQFVGALGYERDADSGLYFIGTRYYDPSVGRFLSQDAAQWGVNWYGYAANNPASAIDANGNNPLVVAGLIGAIGGGIIGGVGAWLNGGDVWKGIGQGIVVGGVAGLTGGWVGGIVSGAIGGGSVGCGAGIVAGAAAGAAEGVVGDLAGQAVSNVMGWQEGWDWQQTVGSGVIGAVTGGVGGWLAAPCFPAGTVVWTAEGQKPIERVKVGDWVRSKEERTGEVSYQRVKRTFRRVSEAIVTVKAGKETIQTTPEHPFWVEGKGWVAAKELEKGERLVTPDEKVVVVTEVRVEAVRGPPTVVYNLEVAGTHTYFVGEQGVWVHNACGNYVGPSWIPPVPAPPGADWTQNWHHIWPKYLGGAEDGPMVQIPRWYHEAIHDAISGAGLPPPIKGNPGGMLNTLPSDVVPVLTDVYLRFPLPKDLRYYRNIR